MVVGLKPMVEMDLIEVGRYKFFPEFVSLGAQEGNLYPGERGDQRLSDTVGTAACKGVGRFHFAQGCRDPEQPMRIAAHEPKSIYEHRPLGGERMDKIRKLLALHHAMALKARDGVIAQRERPLFNAGKPAIKAREVKRSVCSRLSTRITGRGVLSCVPPRSARTGTAECGTGAAFVCHFSGDAMRLRCLLIGGLSRGHLLWRVLVMQPTEDRFRFDSTMRWQSVPRPCSRPLDGSLLIIIRTVRRDPWSQTHMRPALVVMAHPLFQHHSQMTFTERNQEVQTFTPDRSHQPFAVGVALRRPNRRPRHPEAERLQFAIQAA